MSRGISTVLGALLFTIVAVMFVALALRTFAESASTLAEVANINLQNALVENVLISLSPARVTLTASQAGASVWPLYGTVEGDETLLDELDGEALKVVSTAPSGEAARVEEERELVKNGNFSESGRYWTLEPPWSVCSVQNEKYACVNVETNRDFSASIAQDLYIPPGTASLNLSFQYYMHAEPPGRVNSLTLKVYLVSGGNVVWSNATEWDGPPGWKSFSQELSVSVAGPATLRITLVADVKEVGAPATIDVRVDNISLKAKVSVVVPSPVGAAVAAVLISLGNVGAGSNCTLTLALNTTGFVEVYEPAANGVWVMVSKYYVGAGGAWFDVKFKGNAALVYAYSTQQFELMLDRLQVEVVELSRGVTVKVVNAGTAPVTVYSVWLNEMRKQVKRVLLPGDVLSVPFDFAGESGFKDLEVRVVTSTRAHVARFAIDQQPAP